MSDHSKLPSARQILETDAAAAPARPEPAHPPGSSVDDDDFRRVMTALRAVLQMRGT